MKNVVVIGAGNAGSIVANKLQSLGINVTVIERSEFSFYQPGVIDVAFGDARKEDVIKPVKEAVKANIIKDEVVKVDVENHSVVTSSGKTIGYDYLVIAPGAENKRLEGFPSWHSLEDLELLKQQIDKFDGNKIVIGYYGVIKCPAAPFEFAYFFRRRFPRAEITLLNPVTQPPEIQKPMAELLGKLAKDYKINVIRGFKIRDIDRNSKTIISEDGQKVTYDLALIDTPIRAGKAFENLTDNTGFIPVDKYSLRYKDYDNVFAIGDVTNIMIPPKTGGLAHFEAKFVANSIYADINGYEKKRFDGSALCAIYGGSDRGMLVKMNYEKGSIAGPSSLFYIAKRSFMKLYWNTLKGNFII
ncbi:MAG: FAD-dependent oxidoreductase [Sulfolobaceae archaeon]|nr:FAD-dependent oxidoreductase [Sulfolobaceae archaeon]